ncbi:linoleoyl-CoA desaturase [Mycobacterium tuberculosis]|nr:linoleoyl-CoA desaturase [Mycobacterium tuberculosis]
MAITDVDVFAHLTDADIETLAAELDAIPETLKNRAANVMPATSAAPSPHSGRSRCPVGYCWLAAHDASPGGQVP